MAGGPTYQLLMVTVIPALVGLGWLFLAQLLQPPEKCGAEPPTQCPPNHERTQFGVISLADAFDPERLPLWQGQVVALERIGSGMPLEKLAAIWEPYPRICPELYEGKTFAGWLQFLEDCEFVRVAGQAVWLSDEGREFVHCFRCSESSRRTPHSARLS
jgi:hypothetical protein